jgi:hypothetical protein
MMFLGTTSWEAGMHVAQFGEKGERVRAARAGIGSNALFPWSAGRRRVDAPFHPGGETPRRGRASLARTSI